MKSEIKYPEIYRLKFEARNIQKASIGKGIPEGGNKEDWMWYNLSSAIDDIARAFERVFEAK